MDRPVSISPVSASYVLYKAIQLRRSQEFYFRTRSYESNPALFIDMAHNWNLTDGIIREILSQVVIDETAFLPLPCPPTNQST